MLVIMHAKFEVNIAGCCGWDFKQVHPHARTNATVILTK